MNYIFSAQSETKLRGHGWILHLGARGSADYPRCLILPILGRRRGFGRLGYVIHLQSIMGSQILSN